MLHGNAQVESGFSIDKNILVENLHESSITQRLSLNHEKGFCEIDLELKMLSRKL